MGVGRVKKLGVLQGVCLDGILKCSCEEEVLRLFGILQEPDLALGRVSWIMRDLEEENTDL